MSNNKQSSIEWLSNQTYELFEQYSEGNFDRITLNKLVLGATEQAKAMHKEEMIMFVLNVMGSYRHGDVLAEVATELYEQTFGGKQQQ